MSQTAITSKGLLQKITDAQQEELQGKELSWLAYCQARLTLDHREAVELLTKPNRIAVRLVWNQAIELKTVYLPNFEGIPGALEEEHAGMLVFVDRRGQEPSVHLMHLNEELLRRVAEMLDDKVALNAFVATVASTSLEVAVRERVDQYENHFEHCDQEWSDIHSCMCNDKCSNCNSEIEPYDTTTLSSIEMVGPGAIWGIVKAVQPVEAERVQERG